MLTVATVEFKFVYFSVILERFLFGSAVRHVLVSRIAVFQLCKIRSILCKAGTLYKATKPGFSF